MHSVGVSITCAHSRPAGMELGAKDGTRVVDGVVRRVVQ